MYRIVKKGTVVAGTNSNYYIGQITRDDWLDSVQETYHGEKGDLRIITVVPWISIIGGRYEIVKEYLRAMTRKYKSESLQS